MPMDRAGGVVVDARISRIKRFAHLPKMIPSRYLTRVGCFRGEDPFDPSEKAHAVHRVHGCADGRKLKGNW